MARLSGQAHYKVTNSPNCKCGLDMRACPAIQEREQQRAAAQQAKIADASTA